MSLQISEFVGVGSAGGDIIQVPDGAPIRVTNAAGAFTVGADTILIRIKGSGTITWPGVATPEAFDGAEFRRVRTGDTMVIG